MCKPINVDKLEHLYDLVEEYKELDEFVTSCNRDSKVRFFRGYEKEEIETSEVIEDLTERMKEIEAQLNIYGYTMHESPKGINEQKNLNNILILLKKNKGCHTAFILVY